MSELAGKNWCEFATIGVLINARGLMELIILNIGLEKGIITPTLFTIMVIMVIVTILMASPLVPQSGIQNSKFKIQNEYSVSVSLS